MIISNIEMVTLIVILLFGMPIIKQFRKNQLLKSLSFSLIIKSLNQSLLWQGIIAIISLVTVFNLDNIGVVGILGEVSYTFLVVGLFIYLPVLAFLNLINFILKIKWNKG